MRQDGDITAVRAVARGTVEMVLALPGVGAAGEMLLHNHPSGVLEPSIADLSVAARLHDGGVGFGIINNSATASSTSWSRCPRDGRSNSSIRFDVVNTLGERGPVAHCMGQYEDRPQSA